MTAESRTISKTGLSLTARLLGALVVLAVVLVSAYFVHVVFEPGIGSILAVFLILAGFLTLVAMVAESILGKK